MKRIPSKAILLGAGLGTRMRPLSYECPKPMMPLWGVPLMEHMLRMLESWGVQDCLINLHHAPTPIVEFLRHREGNIRIALSYEPDILGTGGMLRRCAWYLKDTSSFWIANTDIAIDVDPTPFITRFRREDAPIAVLCGNDAGGPRTVGIEDGCVTTFRHPSPGAPSTATFCGLQLVSSDLLEFIPEQAFQSIVSAYEMAMKQGRRIAMLTPPDAYWNDLGTPETYLEAHKETAARAQQGKRGKRLFTADACLSLNTLKRGMVSCNGFVAAAPETETAPGSTLQDSVLWPGVRLGAYARLENAIAGKNCRILTSTPLSGVICKADPHYQPPSVTWALRQLDWAPGDVLLNPLPGRGSDRTFTRLIHDHETSLLIEYGRERRENSRHAGHARFLARHGIHVPRILAECKARRWVVESDLGSTSLEGLVKSGGIAKAIPYYRRVIRQVAHFHGLLLSASQLPPCEPAFGPSLYRWEHELFRDHLLNPLRCKGMNISLPGKELDQITATCHAMQPALIHRDLQSSNLLIQGGKVIIIDFQGMRRGPAAYDLASLLCDPYVMLDQARQIELLALYNASDNTISVSESDFWSAAVQRLLQALGAYGRLSARQATKRFAEYIPGALEMLARALNSLNMYPKLERMVSQLKKRESWKELS